MKKFISVLMAIVLVLGLATTTFAATVTPELSANSVQAGEDVTVIVKLDEAMSGITNFEYRLYFNPELFVLKSGENGSANAGTTLTAKAKSDKVGTYYGISFLDTTSQGQTINAGTIYTLVFTALENISEEQAATFKLTQKSMVGENDRDIEEGTVVNGEASITVKLPAAPEVGGYTLTMPADISVVAGETVSVPVVVGHKDGAAYNAFDISFTYDKDILKLTSTEITDMTVETNTAGIVRVLRYGDSLEAGSTAFTLTFKAITTGEATIKATAAKVGVGKEAITMNAADATILDAETVVTISNYTVNLSSDFKGAATIIPGENYTFEAKDKNYDYTFTATMGGEPVTVMNNGDGTFTIEKVTGALSIAATKTAKTYNVTLGDSMNGGKTAQYMTDYTATLTKEAGYSYEVSVKIGNETYTCYTTVSDETAGTIAYTIPGADITGDIAFTVTKTAIAPTMYTVTFDGNGAGAANGATTVAAGAEYSFTLTKAEGYTYTVSYKMGDSTESVSLTEADGKFTIAAVSGNLVITIEEESDLAVEVKDYINLDDMTMFLVKATGTLPQGKAYTYDGNAMFYSDVYKAWCYLVIVGENTTFDAAAAKSNIAAAEITYTTLGQTSDVNMTRKVDVNDAQLVYDMYNGTYVDFNTVSMQKFLHADLDGNGAVQTPDAVAVVNAILNSSTNNE